MEFLKCKLGFDLIRKHALKIVYNVFIYLSYYTYLTKLMINKTLKYDNPEALLPFIMVLYFHT